MVQKGKNSKMSEINILVTSSGTRNKVIQYFKDTLKGIGRVIATDMSINAPSIYEADAFYLVPRITAPNYMDVIYDICKKEKITGILSLIDPELSLLAEHSEELKRLGVVVVGSSKELCDLSLDKWAMYQYLIKKGYNCARSYMNINDFYEDKEKGLIDYPVFVKPAHGSASLSIAIAKDNETLEVLMKQDADMMIQEFLHGQEIGVDCYIDLISGELVSIFSKQKILMRAGETDKGRSFKDEKLFNLVTKFVDQCGFRGQIDIDIFDIDGEYYISEVNPRFGGGYPHAYECGVNHMKMIANNLQGIANEKHIGEYEEGIIMMKYNEVMIRHE